MAICNRWKNSNHQCRSRGSNPGRLRYRPTLYRIAIKAGLYRKAVQVYHIPITTTYSPSILRFAHESQFEQPLNTRPPSLLGHQARQMGLFTLGARCNRWKNSNHQCRSRGSNPGRLRYRPTLYRIAIKAGLKNQWRTLSPADRVRPPVGENIISIFSPVTIFFPDRGSNPVRWTQSPTLYHVAIKAGFYRKAVQVYHIPITTTNKYLEYVCGIFTIGLERQLSFIAAYIHATQKWK